MPAAKAFERRVWRKPQNVDAPEKYTDDFSSDKGYFTEENGKHNWQIENGVLKVSAGDETELIYLHAWEANTTFKARVRITELNPPNSIFGLMLRYSAAEAYTRCGVFAVSGYWFIDSKECADFPCLRQCMEGHPIEVGRWYDLEYKVEGSLGRITLDGEIIAEVDGLSHITPGRPAIFAERISIEVDSVDISFDSGESTLWKGCKHNILPDNQYREGGTVIEMADKTLTYQYSARHTFTSKDNGATWQRAELWNDVMGYCNMLRLINGDIVKMAQINGGVYCMRSSDDGKSWATVSRICDLAYVDPVSGLSAGGGNMNDKVTQSATTGRIFYSLNHQTKTAFPDGREVFCEFFYSDDNGDSWSRSDTASWDIVGNENQRWFGECKILECDDGTFRMYNSWNAYGCVVYADSKDGGKTFGELHKMPELVCARSSMQFFRDPYADNDTTYYMVLVYSRVEKRDADSPFGRSRLALFRSENGKDWDFLGDFWRWEHNYSYNGPIAHLVDPFVTVTKDHVIAGSGVSEQLEIEGAGDYPGHHAQRQHIWSVPKSALNKKPLPPV